MVTVWFIRHGESESNAGLPTSDPFAIKLTDRGDQQAKQIALSFTQQPSLIVTSPYLRTKQTAQLTIERFSSTPQAEWFVQEFTYLSLDRRQPTTNLERRSKVAAYWQQCDPFYVDGDGAESFANLIDRIRYLRQQIEQLDEEFVAVFSHGLFMRAVLWSWLTNSVEISSESMRRFRDFADSFKLPNGAILKLQLYNSDIWFSPIITSHLFEQYA
ncbi:histidine phosphatase family protein [Microseira wollei]|uniref:2,3-bisphosphoglycerate-dependent phosphoglycerate mutase n=1 Tax=Microseira wollei NIES-4236 TaxID=2530354 RepID=A0AAV3XPI9_9CYAN|nr:histidine phosphatase family protein [Microseira wollei]GET43820.1 2,3-bisphosphoglycerate-dependent phosphoglycerate mutase [Microseira wollei NIES-4236]